MPNSPPAVIVVPLDVAPERLATIVGAWPEAALLESGPGFGAAGRWSFYAARPRLVLEAGGRAWRLRSDVGWKDAGMGDPLAITRYLLQRFQLNGCDHANEPDRDLAPFRGGMIGWFSYDLAPRLERLPRKATRDSKLPDIRLALHDIVVVRDHERGTTELHAIDFLREGRDQIERRVREWKERIEQAPRVESVLAAGRLGPIEPETTRERYLRAARRSLHYITAGDIFQVNLSHRFVACGDVDPLTLYLRLREHSPAPFAAYIATDEGTVVSASPEWFYQIRGDRIVTRPIKGTRPRGATPRDDARLLDDLARSEKDRAELTMIIDLERNDLGRVCRYATVGVAEPFRVESFAQVHHLVATVEGRLRTDAGPMDVLAAMFPGGSITGAPKIRAMQIIDELEPTRRGIYTGAIGYIGPDASGFNIAIRTILVEPGRAAFQVGGAIVADSDPEAEYQETLDKAVGMRAAVESATIESAAAS